MAGWGRARWLGTLGILLALTACQHQQDPGVTASPRPPMQVRHDTEQLAKAFPALGDPVSASWIEWDNSSVSVSANTDDTEDGEKSRVKVVWIDAVVAVTPSIMSDLVTQHESEDSGQHPAVQKVLEPQLPPGPFRTGVELNIAFSAQGSSTRVFLDEKHQTVVLQSYNMG